MPLSLLTGLLRFDMAALTDGEPNLSFLVFLVWVQPRGSYVWGHEFNEKPHLSLRAGALSESYCCPKALTCFSRFRIGAYVDSRIAQAPPQDQPAVRRLLPPER